MTRPLWKTLLSLFPKNNPHTLTCDECFELLEYLVDTSEHNPDILAKEDLVFLQQVATAHLRQCPHCQEHHLEMLDDMETKLNRSADD